MENEKSVQDAIHNALVAYGIKSGISVQIHAPANCSQGGEFNKFCADLIFTLNNAAIILLEVKYRAENGLLQSFDLNQHEMLKAYESLNVPIAYAYNTKKCAELGSWQQPQPLEWYIETLQSVARSTPSQLPDQKPKTGHSSLFDWLKSSKDSNAHILFGKIHGSWKAPTNLRNSKIVLIYSATQKTLTALSDKDIEDLEKWFNKNKFTTKHKNEISKILKISNDTQNEIANLQRKKLKIKPK